MMNKRRWGFVGVTTALASLAWIVWGGPTPPGVSSEARVALGNRTVSVLAGATRAEAFRVLPNRSAKGASRIGGYSVRARGAEMDKAFAQKLAGLILQQHLNTAGAAAACNTAITVGFRVWSDEKPGVALRIWKGSDFVDVMLCYQCGEMIVVGKNAYGPLTVGRTGYWPFPDRPAMVQMAKQAFPHDKEIQALSEEH